MAKKPFDISSSGVVYYNGSYYQTVPDMSRESLGLLQSLGKKPDYPMPPKPYLLESVRLRRPVGELRYTYDPQWGRAPLIYTGAVGGSDVFNVINAFDQAFVTTHGDCITPVLNRAGLKVLDKLKMSDLNLGQAWLERKATMGLVTSSARDMASIFKSLRSGNVSQAIRTMGKYSDLSKRQRVHVGKVVRDVSQGAASRLLEVQYGWRPLISDVEGAVNSLGSRTADDFAVSFRKTENDHSSGRKIVGSNWHRCEVAYETHTRSRVIIRATPNRMPVFTAKSLGFTNPALLAWEITPFSHVLDWYLGIGSWLNQFDALLGFTDVVQIQSNTNLIIHQAFPITHRDQYGTFTNKWGTDTGYRKMYRFERNVINGSTFYGLPKIHKSSATRMREAIAHLALAIPSFGAKHPKKNVKG